MSTGSLSPATYPTDAVTIRCDCCSRMGRYKRQTLIEQYGGETAMPDVLNAITAYERNRDWLWETTRLARRVGTREIEEGRLEPEELKVLL